MTGERTIQRVAFGVGDQVMVYEIGNPAIPDNPDIPKVTLIALPVSSLAGFYMLVIRFDDESEKQYLVSPSTIVCEMGEPKPIRPDIAIARINPHIKE